MTLETEFPIFIFLEENTINQKDVANRWVYCKDIQNYQGVASGQTDSNGRTAIEMKYISNDGDVCRIYDGTFEYDFVLNVGQLPPRYYLHQNASTSTDIFMQPESTSTNEISIYVDNKVKTNVNIKTGNY